MEKQPSDSVPIIYIKKLSKEEKEKIKKAIKRKQKKQNKKIKALQEPAIDPLPFDNPQVNQNGSGSYSEISNEEKVEVEYVEEDEYLLTGKYYEEFKHVFAKFARPKQPVGANNEDQEETAQTNETTTKDESLLGKREIDAETGEPKLTRKQKKMQRLAKVAQLKAIARRPDLVELWDVCSPDPMLLIQMKSLRNTVPVPRHWSQKRKFLQNKRGIMKPQFKLPGRKPPSVF